MCILCATVRCSLSNAEHVLALAVYHLLGRSYNVTVVEKGHSGYSEQVHVMYHYSVFCLII